MPPGFGYSGMNYPQDNNQLTFAPSTPFLQPQLPQQRQLPDDRFVPALMNSPVQDLQRNIGLLNAGQNLPDIANRVGGVFMPPALSLMLNQSALPQSPFNRF